MIVPHLPRCCQLHSDHQHGWRCQSGSVGYMTSPQSWLSSVIGSSGTGGGTGVSANSRTHYENAIHRGVVMRSVATQHPGCPLGHCQVDAAGVCRAVRVAARHAFVVTPASITSASGPDRVLDLIQPNRHTVDLCRVKEFMSGMLHLDEQPRSIKKASTYGGLQRPSSVGLAEIQPTSV